MYGGLVWWRPRVALRYRIQFVDLKHFASILISQLLMHLSWRVICYCCIYLSNASILPLSVAFGTFLPALLLFFCRPVFFSSPLGGSFKIARLFFDS